MSDEWPTSFLYRKLGVEPQLSVPKARGGEADVIVEVITGADERPEARVVDVDDLGRLHLALGQVTDTEAAEVLERSGLGRLADPQTAWLDAAALRAAAEPRATAGDWVQQWDAMVAQARSQGWLSDDGASIKVHVESAAGA
jgi:hypothetical protein